MSVFDKEYYYKEFGRFVEINGEMYCDSDCSTCPFAGKCKSEEAEVCIDMILPVRSVIATNTDRSAYTAEPLPDSKFNTESARYEGNTLPYSPKRVYKQVDAIEGVDLEDIKHRPNHIVFAHNRYYCLKQLCEGCRYNKSCSRNLEFRDSYRDVITAIDARAQEPRSFLLTTLITNTYEKAWDKVFYNDTIREHAKEYHTLESAFKKLKVDVEDDLFKLWVDRSFFYDKTELYKLQFYMNNYLIKRDDTARAKLRRQIDSLHSSFKSFVKENSSDSL